MVGGALLTSCAGGGGGSSDSSSQGGFQLTKISVLEGSIWEINRQMEFTFNQDVNFATVSLNTINIQTNTGMPATGSFFLKGIDADGDGIDEATDPRAVLFQPTCPTLADLSDAGLQPGSIPYTITVPGLSSGAVNTVRSMSGAQLRDSQTRNFTTPSSSDAGGAFIDTVAGPPVPVIRSISSLEENATHIEYGIFGDTVYFEFDEITQGYSLSEAGFEVPLNLFSDPGTSVAVHLFFNQPVSPGEENITQDLLRLEFLDANLDWQPIDTRVELVANCTQTGALVRLEPIGILPVASEFRTVVRPGFQDLVGQTNLLTIDKFGVAPTTTVAFASLTPEDDQSDELLEEFMIGGNHIDSFEDADALAPSPLAEWAGGQLTMAFDFEGTGGPGGDFDWVIRTGEIFFFDTTATTIIGGPGGIPTSTQNTVNGFVDVRDLIVEEGGTLRVQGPNVMTVSATGSVQIRGTVDISGFNAKDVATLNTGNQPEVGGAGAAGGGKGGIASWVINNSTPYGGSGWGAYDLVNGGGQGGETGYELSSNKHNRRPGGGGAGGMAHLQTHWGAIQDVLFGHDGNPGHTESSGALTNTKPAMGGTAGAGPFLDGDDTNNFYGVFADGGTNPVTYIRGEAQGMQAGSGGGGGGDALPFGQFPADSPWGIGSDEKGGGGGGGAGGINIRCLGPITFGEFGVLRCDGGLGATGENVLYLDHIGGSGGSGSGGHIVLETAAYIDFTDAGLNLGMGYNEFISAQGGPEVEGNTGWLGDEPDASHGGQGGPGVIQFHVPNPLAPVGTTLDDSHYIFVPIIAAFEEETALHYVSKPGGIPMVPLFGARSVAQSKWISIGGADQNPGGGETQVDFVFQGTDGDPITGLGNVITSGDGIVDDLPAVLAESISGSATVAVLADGVTLSISGASLDPLRDPTYFSNDIYLRAPDLLKNFLLRLSEAGNSQDFDVVAADYDDDNIVLTLTVDDVDGSLQNFLNLATNPVGFALIPRFFRVSTGGVLDALPETADVRIFFHATIADQFGRPDEEWYTTIGDQSVGNEGNIYDIADFNALLPGQLQFFRFVVVFELDSVDASTEKVALDFVRIPFRF